VRGIEEEVDLASILAGELVDRPRGHGRLPETLYLLRFLPATFTTQLARNAITLGDERRRLDREEAVQLFLEFVHAHLLVRRRGLEASVIVQTATGLAAA
jgi:hypothetical protein